jgi:hypothetical protein
MKLFFIFFTLSLYAEKAFAYLGPGMAGGVLIATLGIIIAILIGLFGILWFPIKKYILHFKKKKSKKK